ncbi:MAG TPA: hypothetical protein VIO61_08560 [Anaerolineaceae bacterium]
MNPQVAKSALGAALFIVIASLFAVVMSQPGSAEFVISVLALGVGLITTGVVAYAIYRFSR